MVGEYYRGTEKRGFKHTSTNTHTHTFSPPQHAPWSNAQLALHSAIVVGDVNKLWLWLNCAVNSALPLALSKYSHSHQQPSDVSWGEEMSRGKRLTFSLWKEWRKFPLSSPSSLGVPGGLLMPLKLFGEFWKQKSAHFCECKTFHFFSRLSFRRQRFCVWLQYLPCSFHPCHQSLRMKQYEKQFNNVFVPWT